MPISFRLMPERHQAAPRETPARLPVRVNQPQQGASRVLPIIRQIGHVDAREWQ